AGLDAAIHNKDGKPDLADQLLKEFLVADPDNVTLTLMRSQILTESLKRPKEARELLLALSERCDNSSPLVRSPRSTSSRTTSTRRRRPSPGFASAGMKQPPATSWKDSSRSGGKTSPPRSSTSTMP